MEHGVGPFAPCVSSTSHKQARNSLGPLPSCSLVSDGFRLKRFSGANYAVQWTANGISLQGAPVEQVSWSTDLLRNSLNFHFNKLPTRLLAS